MLTRPISFRAGDLEAELASRCDTPDDATAYSQVARRELDNYFTLLRLSLTRFSEAEASLIVDALNGSLFDPQVASLLWANISDALEDGLADKWQVDGEALVAHLRKLTPFEAWAVIDAAERFWNSVTTDGEMPHADRLRKVGLIR